MRGPSGGHMPRVRGGSCGPYGGGGIPSTHACDLRETSARSVI